jgi:hypothetical protein
MYSTKPAERLQTLDPPFSQKPVLSGLIMLAATLMDNFAASCAVDKWWTVMPTAHLYNALRANGYIDWEWKSMEDMIRIYTPEYIFNGGRPTDLNACFVKLLLAKGLAADVSLPTTNGRGDKVKIARKLRKLQPRAPSFMKGLFQWMMPEKEIARAEDYMSERLLLPLMQRTVDSTSTDKSPSTTDFSEISLLKAVREGLTKELPFLQTRLWALNEDCTRIQVGLHDALVHKFRQASQQNYDRMDKSPLANVSEDVLKVTDALDDKRILFKAVEVFKTVFKK